MASKSQAEDLSKYLQKIYKCLSIKDFPDELTQEYIRETVNSLQDKEYCISLEKNAVKFLERLIMQKQSEIIFDVSRSDQQEFGANLHSSTVQEQRSEPHLDYHPGSRQPVVLPQQASGPQLGISCQENGSNRTITPAQSREWDSQSSLTGASLSLARRFGRQETTSNGTINLLQM